MSIEETRLLPKLKNLNDWICWDNNEFKISNDIRNSLSKEKQKEFRRIYKNTLFYLKSEFFLHPQMETAIELITPEWKKGNGIRNEWFKTIAHNAAWIWVWL